MRLLKTNNSLVSKVVVFTSNNARILVNIPRKELVTLRTYLENPDLTKVKGVPPHFWKLVNNKIVPMNDFEQSQRRSAIERSGIDNNPYKLMKISVWTGRLFVSLQLLGKLAFIIASFLFLYEMVSRL